MLNKSVVQLLSMLCVLALLAACGDGEDRQAKYLERAQENFDAENYEKARIEAQNVLQINPKNTAARQLLGEISMEDGNVRKAYGMFLSVEEAEPENVAALTQLAKLFIMVKDSEKALEYSNKVLAIEPDDAQVLGYKSIALVAMGEVEQAEATAEQALALDKGITEAIGVMVQKHFNAETPEEGLAVIEAGQAANPDEPRINAMKISLLESMGRKDAVEAELIKLTEKYPEDRNYAITLSKYYIRESRLEEGEAVLRRHVENNAEDVDAKLELVSFLLQHNSKDVAISQVESFLKDSPDESRLSLALAELHLFTGDKESAIVALSQTIDRNPRSVGAIDARNLLAAIYLEDQNREPAEKLLDEIFEIEPENPAALLARAKLALQDRKYKDGIADLRVILKNDPESEVALKLLAGAQEAEGSGDLALDNLKRLISLQDPDLTTLASAARLAIQAEQYQEAENFIRQALELDANNAALVTDLIRLLVLKEDFSAAGEFAQRLIEKDESKALGYFLQAGLDQRTGDVDSAIKNLRASLVAEPKAVESLTTLASLLVETEGVDSSIKFIDNHCETNPGQAHCRHILGTLYAQAAEYDKALEELNTAISINDKQVTSYRQIAKVYAAQRDADSIIATLKRGIDATNDQKLAFELAGFYYQMKDFQKSSEVYISMLETNPDDLSAKNNLAMLYAEFLNTPENVKKAAALVADLQDSENPAYLDTVGWVLYLTGEYDRAVTYLQAAVDQVGSSGLLQYHLGMAYYKVGDMENAKTHLTLAVENKEARYEGFDVAEATLAELNQG